MIDITKVRFLPLNFKLSEEERILQSLKVLFSTYEGTVPFDRNFGIDGDILDAPLPVAQGKLLVEYRNKAAEYEPRASIQEIQYETLHSTGVLIPKVVIAIE